MDVGDVLAGRYELLDEVGVGGMGRVLRARDRTLDRVVAVKLLAPHLLGDEVAVAALRDEARRAAAVRHPNIVQVLDAVLDDTDQPAIVMEFVDGPTLASVVPDGGLDLDEALAVLRDVGAGLRAVHEAGLVHRDVTPGNVLMDGGVPRLADFGIARSAAATSTQTVQGSVGYLAPEQANGAAVGPGADVYALGCLATTLLTGRPPFEAETPVGVVHHHLNEPPPDLRSRRPEIPAGVAEAVGATLSKRPEERPASVEAFLALITGHGVAQSGAAGLGSAGGGAVGLGATERMEPAATTVLPADARRWPTAGVVLAGLGVVAVAWLAALAVGGDEPVPDIAAVPTPTSAPSPSASPEPPPSPSPSPSPSPLAPRAATATALRDLRALLVDLRQRDAVSAEALEKLDERVAEAIDKLDEDKANDVAKAVRELRKELGDRVEKDEVTREAENELLAQILVVEDAVDAIPPGEGRDDEDEDDD